MLLPRVTPELIRTSDLISQLEKSVQVAGERGTDTHVLAENTILGLLGAEDKVSAEDITFKDLVLATTLSREDAPVTLLLLRETLLALAEAREHIAELEAANTVALNLEINGNN